MGAPSNHPWQRDQIASLSCWCQQLIACWGLSCITSLLLVGQSNSLWIVGSFNIQKCKTRWRQINKWHYSQTNLSCLLTVLSSTHVTHLSLLLLEKFWGFSCTSMVWNRPVGAHELGKAPGVSQSPSITRLSVFPRLFHSQFVPGPSASRAFCAPAPRRKMSWNSTPRYSKQMKQAKLGAWNKAKLQPQKRCGNLLLQRQHLIFCEMLLLL